MYKEYVNVGVKVVKTETFIRLETVNSGALRDLATRCSMSPKTLKIIFNVIASAVSANRV